MSSIKLKLIPDREDTVRVAVNLKLSQQSQLDQYAEFYSQVHRKAAPAVSTLIPHMLSAFLAEDKAFQKWQAEQDKQRSNSAA